MVNKEIKKHIKRGTIIRWDMRIDVILDVTKCLDCNEMIAWKFFAKKPKDTHFFHLKSLGLDNIVFIPKDEIDLEVRSLE